MSDQNQAPQQPAEAAAAPQKPSILTERSLQPAGRDATGRATRLQINIRRDCVSLSAPLDGEWASILFTISEFDTLLINLNQVIVAKEPMTGEVDAYVGSAENRRLDGTVRYGRDEDGVIYITIISSGREQRYDFLPSQNYVWKINGQPLPTSESSRRNAQAWIGRIGKYCGDELRDNFVGFQGRQNQGQGQGQAQGGGYQRQGGFNRGGGQGGGNYNRGGGGGGGWKQGGGQGGWKGGNNNYQGKGGGNGYQNNGYNRGGNGGGNYNRGGGGGGGYNQGGGNRNYQGSGNYQPQAQAQNTAQSEPSVDFESYINDAT